MLLLKSHLAARVVNTSYYAPLVEFVLNNQDPSEEEPPYHLSVENIANQLLESGHEAEAGSLLLKHKGAHPAMLTFDAAVGYITRWFSR